MVHFGNVTYMARHGPFRRHKLCKLAPRLYLLNNFNGIPCTTYLVALKHPKSMHHSFPSSEIGETLKNLVQVWLPLNRGLEFRNTIVVKSDVFRTESRLKISIMMRYVWRGSHEQAKMIPIQDRTHVIRRLRFSSLSRRRASV